MGGEAHKKGLIRSTVPNLKHCFTDNFSCFGRRIFTSHSWLWTPLCPSNSFHSALKNPLTLVGFESGLTSCRHCN